VLELLNVMGSFLMKIIFCVLDCINICNVKDLIQSVFNKKQQTNFMMPFILLLVNIFMNV